MRAESELGGLRGSIEDGMGWMQCLIGGLEKNVCVCVCACDQESRTLSRFEECKDAQRCSEFRPLLAPPLPTPSSASASPRCPAPVSEHVRSRIKIAQQPNPKHALKFQLIPRQLHRLPQPSQPRHHPLDPAQISIQSHPRRLRQPTPQDLVDGIALPSSLLRLRSAIESFSSCVVHSGKGGGGEEAGEDGSIATGALQFVEKGERFEEDGVREVDGVQGLREASVAPDVESCAERVP